MAGSACGVRKQVAIYRTRQITKGVKNSNPAVTEFHHILQAASYKEEGKMKVIFPSSVF